MSGSREYCELGMWETGQVACHTSTQQSKHFDSVFGADNIGVSDHDQGWCLYGLNILSRPVRDMLVQLIHFSN